MSYPPNIFFEDAAVDAFGTVMPLRTPLPPPALVHAPRYPKAEPRPAPRLAPDRCEIYRGDSHMLQPAGIAPFRIPPSSLRWKDADVHRWSPAMRELLKVEYPRLRDQSRVYAQRFDESVAEIRAKYAGDEGIARVMDKMASRKMTIDVDLHGVVPAGLLALVWTEHVRRVDEPECYALFGDTLRDMGATCIQGDTHRLFAILVALHRSDEPP